MTLDPYLRQARVEIGVPDGRLIVDGLRIAFEIRSDAQPDASPSNLKIYNLARDTERRIEKGTALRLYAGYGSDDLPLLHQGEIVRVEQERTGLDRVTTLSLGASQQTSLTRSIFAKSYKGTVALIDIVSDIVSNMGLNLWHFAAIPNVRIENYVYSGKSADALTGLLRPRGIEWYVHVEEVRFSRRGSADPTMPTYRLSEHNGLIGSPSRTDNGARAKMRLTHQIQLDQRIRIESEALTGVFKAGVVAHKGDTWEGEWVTEIEASSIR